MTRQGKKRLPLRHSRSNSKVCVKTVASMNTRVKSVRSTKQEGIQKKFRGACWYCGKNGHNAQDCEKRKANETAGGEQAKMAIGDADDASVDWTCERGL